VGTPAIDDDGTGRTAELVNELRSLSDQVSLNWSRDPLARRAGERMLEAAAALARMAEVRAAIEWIAHNPEKLPEVYVKRARDALGWVAYGDGHESSGETHR
jgi:hypothetical protein